MKNLIRVRTTVPQPRVYMRKPKLPLRRLERPAAFVSQEFLNASYFAGKYITLFVFFYSSLNYLYYRNLRQEEDNED